MAKQRVVPRQPFLSSWLASPPAWLCAGVLVLVTLAVYAPMRHAGYVWDDDAHVTKNPTLRNIAGLHQIWFDPDMTPQYYPLVHTTFWLEYQMWGLHPLGFHLVNLMLHACNAVLLWLILRRLAVPGAFWAALLFAIHPVHVESVAWISERKNVLSGLCYLSSFLVWLRFWPPEEERPPIAHRWPLYVLVLLLFLCALLSKTVTCSLPAVFLLLRWWKQGRISVRDLLVTAPLFALALPLALHTAYLEKYHVGAQGQEFALSHLERLLIAGRAVCFYAGKLVWPASLAFNYRRWHIHVANWREAVFPLAVLSSLLVLYALRCRLGRGPLTAGLFFVGTLVPALGFFNVYPMRYSLVADHFQYLASIGVLVLVGAGIAWVLCHQPRRLRYASGAALVLAVTILGALTWQRAEAYHDARTLWSDSLAKNPGSSFAYSNRAQVYQGSGQWQRAIEDYTRALELAPETASLYDNRGACYHQLGEFDKAIVEETRAIELEPNLATAYANRGHAFQALGQVQFAINDYTRALDLKPTLAGAYVDRGLAYCQRGQLEHALSDYSRAIELAPDRESAYSNRGMVYQQLGQAAQALADYSRAIELKPKFVEAYCNRAIVEKEIGQTHQALADCSRAAELRPDMAYAYFIRGTIFLQTGEVDQAISDYSRVISLEPRKANGYWGRYAAYRKAGRYQQALDDYSQVLALSAGEAPRIRPRADLSVGR